MLKAITGIWQMLLLQVYSPMSRAPVAKVALQQMVIAKDADKQELLNYHLQIGG